MGVRVALILNSRSGSVGDPDALVARIREATDSLSVHDPGEGTAAAATHPDRIVVAGGDGSIGDAFAAAAGARIPLAVIPAGTANDFARALELPEDRDEAIALAVDPDATLQPTWGGRLDGRPFVNAASVGLAVDAAERADELKRRLGPLAYAAGALQAGIVGRSVDADLTVDDHLELGGKVYQLLIGASGRFGGGSGLGEADPEVPQLVAAWVPATSRLELPMRAIGLRRQTLEQQPGVRWWRAHRLAVNATVGGRAATWNLDGEVWRPPPGPTIAEPLGPVNVAVPSAPAG